MTDATASSSSSDWQSLKAEGNALFKSKQFGAAQTVYTNAIDAIGRLQKAAAEQQSSSGPSALSGDLCVLYSNRAACAFQLGCFVESLADADRALAADPRFLKAHMRRALAMEKIATTPASSSSSSHAVVTQAQQVAHIQEAMAVLQKLAQILRAGTPATATPAAADGAGAAAATPAPAAASGPSLAEVNATLVRLRATLASLHSRAASPQPFLQILREATAPAVAADASDASASSSTASASHSHLKPRAAVRGLMQLVASSGASRLEAQQGGMVELLLALVLGEASQAPVQSMRTRSAAVRALRYLLSTDMSSGSSPAVASALVMDPWVRAAPKILGLFESLRLNQTGQVRQVPPPLPAASANLGEMMRSMCGLLSRIASHPRLGHTFTEAISAALTATLPKFSTHSPPALAALLSAHSSASSPAAISIRVSIAAIEALTFMASSPFLPRALMQTLREQWMGLLLLEPLAQAAAHDESSSSSSGGGGVVGCAQLRAAILAAVAVLTRNALPRPGGSGAAASAAAASSVLQAMAPMLSKSFGGTNPLGGGAAGATNPEGGELTEEQQKELEIEGQQIREQALKLLYAPLVGAVAPAVTAADSVAAADGMVSVQLNFNQATRLVRGLSLLLQANTMLGIHVVSFGATKQPDLKSGPASAPAADAETKQTTNEEEKEEQKQKEQADQAPNSSPEPSPSPAPEQVAPTVLQLLLSLSSYVSQSLLSTSSPGVPDGSPPKPLQLLAAEVLALASSDATIRHTLVALSQPTAASEELDEELRAEGVRDFSTGGRGADVFMDLIVQYTDLGNGADSAASAAATRTGGSAGQQPPPPPPSRDPNAPAPNETIVAHACLALSKLVAVGEWGSSISASAATPSTAAAGGGAGSAEAEAEQDELDLSDSAHEELAVLLHILLRLIEKHQASVPRLEKDSEKEAKVLAKIQAAKQARAAAVAARKAKVVAALAAGHPLEDDDADDEDEDGVTAGTDDGSEDSESFFVESLRLQKVSLLHLCFESLSYLSLHAYAKKWLVSDSGGHAIKMLVGIATGVPVGAGGSGGSSSAALGVVSDSTVRYGLLHLFRNLCTSRASLEASHNAEVEALKKMASRGLGGSGTSAALNERQNATQQRLAGPPELVNICMRVLAQVKVGAALVQLYRAYVIQQQELDANKDNPAKSSSSTSASSSTPATTPAAATTSASLPVLSVALANAFAFTLLHLATVVENRGLLVQQGCVRLLLDLYAGSLKPGQESLSAGAGGGVLDRASQDENASPNSPSSPWRCSLDCLSALARIFISTNPALVSETTLPAVVLALLEGLEHAEHELLTFETLMALTNLASFRTSEDVEGGVDLAEYICVGAQQKRGTGTGGKKGAAAAARSGEAAAPLNGWYLAKAQLVSSNELVQRAAVELMTNLVNCAWLRRRLRNVPAELEAASGGSVTKAAHAESLAQAMKDPGNPQSEDLRLLLAFALSEDVATACAATGALAMLSSDELLAARIAATRVVSFVSSEQSASSSEEKDESVVATVAEDGLQAPPNTRPLVRTGVTIARKILKDPSTHPDVIMRVRVLQDNMDAILKATAAGSAAAKASKKK